MIAASAEPDTPSFSPYPWVALCCLLALGSVLVWALDAGYQLAWLSATWRQTPWTLWTAPLLHLSAIHMLGNLMALAALAVLGLVIPLGARAALALFLAWPLSTASLMAWPEVTRYVGLSGLIHASVAIVWLHARQAPVAQRWSPLLLAALLLKLVTEQAWLYPVSFDPYWNINVVAAGHLGGAVVGLVCGAVCLIRLRPSAAS
ncbi:rhombosortase [Variovorax sp. HJSM1_2]|uniref:rhombosortase n=1 Tax=Variovorax sp. HJSM1_2 TaxID=3366263 RepID=UPI003BC084C5